MQANTRSTLNKYWLEVRRHWLSGFVIALAVALAACLNSFTPLFVKDLLNTLASSVPDKKDTLIKIFIIIGFLEFSQWALWRLATFTNSYFQTNILASLANQCFKYLHQHSFTFFNSNFVGSLVKRVNYFTRAFEDLADRVIWNILPLVVNLAVILTVLFSINLTLGFAIVVWMIIFMIVNVSFARYKLKYDLKRSEAETKATSLLADTITNQSNVKLFVGYGSEVLRFAKATELVRKLRKFNWDLDCWFEAAQGFLTVILTLTVYYLAIQMALKNTLTIGDFVLLQTYLIIIFNRVWDFARIIRGIYIDLADANEMTIMLDTPHEVQDAPNAKALTVTNGKIEFKNVDFYYHETRRIFSGLNLLIPAKQKIALVGPSGAGKTTVVKLLMRQYDITSGQIEIDGQDIAKITQGSLWSGVSLVPQDPMLFHRSLLENIRYGKMDATDDEVKKAAKLAHCDEFIDEFPEHYNTFVGERGVKLSGGERQRVAIARAILCNAPILVLDEATSSLDSESEHLIQDALNVLMKDKTVIVVAHRLSTIMKMDRIVVIDHGEIIEDNTHQELLKNKSGLYTKLWTRQAGGFIPE